MIYFSFFSFIVLAFSDFPLENSVPAVRFAWP